MRSKDALVLKALAELGLVKRPSSLSPEIAELEQRIKEYEKEFGSVLNPELLKKFLG